MIPIRELRKHESAYHGFVKMVAYFTAAALVTIAIVIALIS